MRPCLIALGLLLTAGLARADDADLVKSDEALLRSAEVGVDGPSLLDFLRRLTLRDSDRAQVRTLIKLLGDEDFQTREKASGDLIRMGAIAVGPLRQAARHDDLEVARRADRCLEAIGQQSKPACVAAAIRLLAVRRPEGAVETLLNFLPSSGDANDLDEASRVLGRLAVRDGAVDPLLVRALAAADVAKRAVAGEVLARAGMGDRIPEVRKLLADRDPSVRYRVSLALLQARDRDAIPVLIDLLQEMAPEQTEIIEETLLTLAADKAPTSVPGHTEAARQRRAQGWLAWWQTHGQGLDLDKIELQNRQLGHTLLVLYGLTTGSVREIDRTGKLRWQIDNLAYPVDAQALPGDRVLLCEYRTRIVSERELQGRVIWQYDANTFPLNVRRLANGNTFIVTRLGLVEVNREGKEIWRHNHHATVVTGARLRDGSSVLVTFTGEVIRVDREGRELKKFSAGGTLSTIGTAIGVTPDGRILVPLYSRNKVVEFDQDGKPIWEAEVRMPGSVFCLPGGNVLVTSRLNTLVQELDRTGRVVWSQQTEGRLMRATRR